MPRGRGDFGEWDEDEIPSREMRMRDRQLGGVDNGVPGEEDIDIDGSRTFDLTSSPLQQGLNATGQFQELMGSERTSDLDRLIDKPGLIEDVDGLGQVHERLPEDFHSVLFEQAECPGQVLLPIADVAAQTQKIIHGLALPPFPIVK